MIASVNVCDHCNERVSDCEKCGRPLQPGDLSTCGALVGSAHRHQHLEIEKCYRCIYCHDKGERVVGGGRSGGGRVHPYLTAPCTHCPAGRAQPATST